MLGNYLFATLVVDLQPEVYYSTRMKMTILSIFVLVISSFLVGCTNEKQEPTPVPLTEQRMGTTNAGNVKGESTTLSNGSTTVESLSVEEAQSLKNNPERDGMKVIQDFQPIEGTIVTFTTSKGDVVIKLFRDKAPLTTLNFLSLVKDGFYDGIVFHRVIPGFMAQFGDPLTKDASKQALWGTGGPGYAIADEFAPGLTHDSEGIVSMANSGPNTGGSQVFITYDATPWLDGKHAIFGKVESGMDVVKQLTNGDTILSATIQ